MGATDTTGRLLASIFQYGPADPTFVCSLDVRNGGVLLGLPGLLSMGLLAHTEYFALAAGYYRLDSIFLLLAFMALARIKTIESLRYCPPGEWGKLLGLDRIPEAKTLRAKVRALTKNGQAQHWGGALSRDWMAMFPETAGVLYVDGHVRVYNGSQTELPRHYVARQQLCLRATTDYWVNAMDGQPFFMVNQPVDPGLLKVLEEEIVPRLEREIPWQPGLFGDEDRLPPRFTLVFDREGYSPEFMARMRAKGIACMTYNKYPGDDWPVAEFAVQEVRLVSGQTVTLRLAERGILLGKTIWVREVRKLSPSGHQTAIVATDGTREMAGIAAAMFARWSQENFFKYMREHYSLDRLADYSTAEIPGSTRVVNPQYREVDGEVRKQAALLARKRCECDSIVLCDDIEPEKVTQYETKKSALREAVTEMTRTVADLKSCRKATPRHVQFADLPKEDRFRMLGMKGKYFIDTIKLIAYRAETAMVNIVRQTLRRQDDARSLLRSLYAMEADILPDHDAKTLTVRLHQPANRCSRGAILHLIGELNATWIMFPGTDLRLCYELVS
ncbi:MAG: hypothetical protein HGA43_14705 [Nitrospirae bacterium]|nr:hypothetical protein [Nitrospirota bacterium]